MEKLTSKILSRKYCILCSYILILHSIMISRKEIKIFKKPIWIQCMVSTPGYVMKPRKILHDAFDVPYIFNNSQLQHYILGDSYVVLGNFLEMCTLKHFNMFLKVIKISLFLNVGCVLH